MRRWLRSELESGMRVPGKAALLMLAAMLVGGWVSQGQEAGAMSSAELNKEAATADSLVQSQNVVEALPLYEDLHKQQPENNTWRERLATCLLGASVGRPSGEATAMRERAHKLLLDAKAAGDNSNLLQILLEKLDAAASAAPAAGPASPGIEALLRAEKAFSSGDLPGALKGYQEAMAADPKLYEAPLFAGDAEYKQGHYPAADKWYAQAVAIDRDRETAYRYWGDCLMKQGDATQAEARFIDAIVAEPYARAPRVGLKQWADATKAMLASPPVTLPARASVDAKGNTNITVDQANPGPGMGATMMYSMNSALWMTEKFKKTYPAEKQYRHSLAEEADSIHGALTVLKEQKVSPDKMDATWRTLLDIDKDGMLEGWILLDHADQGIAQDYAAYRAQHRDLLHAYIAKYDVHPK